MISSWNTLLSLLIICISCRGCYSSVRDRKDLCPKIYPSVFVGYRPSGIYYIFSTALVPSNSAFTNQSLNIVFQVKKMLEHMTKSRMLHLMDVLWNVASLIVVMLFSWTRMIVTRYDIFYDYVVIANINITFYDLMYCFYAWFCLHFSNLLNIPTDTRLFIFMNILLNT